MLIQNGKKFIQAAFENEDELEKVVLENYENIFGPSSIYLPKTLIKTSEGIGTVTDGFVIDLASVHPSYNYRKPQEYPALNKFAQVMWIVAGVAFVIWLIMINL